MENNNQKICKRCLYKDMSQEGYHEMIEKYIDILAESDKTEAMQYDERLNICRQCDKLNAGTCNSCGCYVEIRAAMKKAKCPNNKW